MTAGRCRAGGSLEETTMAEPEILKYFAYEHLPLHMQPVSKAIGDVARDMAARLPPSAELSAGLRKLLEAKDCLVRATLDNAPR